MSTNWIYESREVTCMEDFPDHDKLYGFVYMISNIHTGKFYIGKKALKFTRKKKISKTVKKQTRTRKIYERVIKESDWLNYYGSCKELSDDVKFFGKSIFKRQIIELCYSKKSLSYAELKWQILKNVLQSHSYNGNILGRFYPKDLQS